MALYKGKIDCPCLKQKKGRMLLFKEVSLSARQAMLVFYGHLKSHEHRIIAILDRYFGDRPAEHKANSPNLGRITVVFNNQKIKGFI